MSGTGKIIDASNATTRVAERSLMWPQTSTIRMLWSTETVPLTIACGFSYRGERETVKKQVANGSIHGFWMSIKKSKIFVFILHKVGP